LPAPSRRGARDVMVMPRDIPPGARKLSDVEEADALSSRFGCVFAGSDPFGTPFVAQVESRAILFPVRYRFDEAQFFALSSAAAAMGESTAFLQWTEDTRAGVFELPLEYPIYKRLMGVGGALENRLCSTRGSWGLLFS